MRRELATLGLRTAWAALLAARNLVKTVWDPTRSDIQHGINTLINEVLGGRAPALALAVLVLHLALRKPDDVKQAIRLAGEWMALGERARPYTEFRLEDLLERPIAEVRGTVMAAA